MKKGDAQRIARDYLKVHEPALGSELILINPLTKGRQTLVISVRS